MKGYVRVKNEIAGNEIFEIQHHLDIVCRL